MRGPGGQQVTDMDSARYDAAIWLLNNVRGRQPPGEPWAEAAREALRAEFGPEGIAQAARYSRHIGGQTQMDAILQIEADFNERRARAIRREIEASAVPTGGAGLGDFS